VISSRRISSAIASASSRERASSAAVASSASGSRSFGCRLRRATPGLDADLLPAFDAAHGDGYRRRFARRAARVAQLQLDQVLHDGFVDLDARIELQRGRLRSASSHSLRCSSRRARAPDACGQRLPIKPRMRAMYRPVGYIRS
jgi:hypothetical protein